MSLKDYLTKKPVLETERLILRELRPEDTDDLREWLSDPGLYLYWGKRPGRHDLKCRFCMAEMQLSIRLLQSDSNLPYRGI